MSNRNSAMFALKSVIALACLASSPASVADQVFNSDLSFTTADQSMWDSGGAFIFDYLQFFGIDPAPQTTVVNPPAVSGGTAPFSHWTVDPYFQFRTDSKLGMEIGAKINSGSIDANLDYNVSLEALDDIVAGTPFSLTGIATKQVTSSFQSSPANAEAWVDGVVQASLGGYARITTGGSAFVFGTHDYRMGNSGFTDDPASNSNNPYRSLINVNEKPEIIGINRNESGQLHVLGQNQGGTGSEYVLGPTTITAGNWNVSATGALDGAVLQGSDEKVLVTASLDIDQMATTAAGLPPLGAGVAHDYGAIAFDIGYEILDVKAVLELGLRQDFSITSDVTAHLQFSENVMIDGLGETNSYLGPLDTIPDITLLSNSVTVIPEFIVAAQLNNDTDLTVTESLPITLFEGHADFSWDVAGVSGSRTNGFGPVFQDTPLSNTNAIDVYSNQFALGGFDVIQGDSFVLQVSMRWTDTTPGGSNFNTVANWSTNTMPSAADNAKIDNGGTAIVNSTAAIRNLRVGGTPEGGTLQLDPGGDLTANELSVSANGTVNFHGGSVSATSYQLDKATLHIAQNVTHVNAAPVALTGTNAIDVDSGGLFDQTAVVSGAGALSKQGAGTLILSGANSYMGGTTIEQGMLQTGANQVIPVGQVVVKGGGTLDLNGHTEQIGPGNVAVTGLELQDDAQVLAGNLLTISVAAAGTFIDYSSGTTGNGASIHSGELLLGTGSPTRNISVADNLAADDDLSISTTISNAATNPDSATPVINKQGPGRLTLSGDNTFWRGVRVSAGNLRVEGDGGLGNGVNTANTGTEVIDGATLELRGGVTIDAEHLTLHGAGVGAAGALRSVSGDNAWSGKVVLAENSSIGVDADSLTVSGAITGAGELTKLGDGVLQITSGSSNTYAGSTNVDAGTLLVANSGRMPNHGAINVAAGATLRYQNVAADAIFALNGQGNVDILDSILVLGNLSGVGVNGGLGTFTGTMTGNATGKLEKRGLGAFTFAGAGTYVGPTEIENGDFQLTGSISGTSRVDVLNGVLNGGGTLTIDGGSLTTPGTTTVAAGATIELLGGSLTTTTLTGPGIFSMSGGRLTAVNVTRDLTNEGGTLSPGAASSGMGPGLTTVTGNYEQLSSAVLEIEIGGDAAAGIDFDVLDVSGTATLAGTLDVLLVDLGSGVFAPTAGDSFEILTAGTLSSTFETEILPSLSGQLAWNVNYDTVGNRVLLEVLTPFTADVDGDGDVDGGDFLSIQRTSPALISDWQSQFGSGLSASGAVEGVPEPSACAMLLWGVLTLILRRKNA